MKAEGAGVASVPGTQAQAPAVGAAAPSGARIMARCAALARCSEDGERSLTRVFLSDAQRAANALVLAWMREAGMSARLDAIGNAVGRREGDRPGLPCLLLGSHLDTVRDAGRYDGALGVVAAIECVHVLSARGARLPFAIEVIGFADEEGVRFGSTLLGSRAVAGTFDAALLDRRDRDGTTMRDALRSFDLDPGSIPRAARRRGDVLGYAELHIEQGSVLETEGLPVGNVTAINGAQRLIVELQGTAGHAGTVPMDRRRDALAGAAQCVVAVEASARRRPGVVATVGMLEARPGAMNVIAGEVQFSVDVRSAADAERRAAVEEVVAAFQSICAARGLSAKVTPVHENASVACAEWLQDRMRAAIRAEGHLVRDLPSGAGHDGMALLPIADICMLFVRCRGGISHHPAEAVTEEDAASAARVLLRFVEDFRTPALASR